MADNNYENQAAAASLPAPVPDVPAAVEDEVGKQLQVKELRRPLLAMQIVKAPVAVMPADSKKTPTPPVVPDHCTLMVVLLWATLNAYFFIAKGIATVILNFFTKPSRTKLPWHFRYVTLTNEAADKMWFLLCGELLCSATSTAALMALCACIMLLLTTRTTTTTFHRRAAAVVHAMAWVALAATVGMHCMKVASDRILHAAVHGNSTVDHVAFIRYICLAVDLLAGIILSCSPRRRLELAGEHLQDGDEDEKV